MKASYTKISSLCNLRLFLALFFVSSCQIDQSVSLIKEKLFSGTDEVEEKDNKTSKSTEMKNKKIEESLLNEEIEEDDEKIQKEQIVINLKDDKPENFETLDAKGPQDTSVLPIKEMGQTKKTESKIVSFFTKFFEDDEPKVLIDKKNQSEFSIQKIENIENTIKREDNFENIDNSESEDIGLIGKKYFSDDSNILESASEEIEDGSIKDNNITEEVKESEKGSPGLAFLNLKKPEFKEKEIETDNLVGLLLPLTGEKSAAGNLVINSLRYSMLLSPNQLNFKIYDTKGTPDGAVRAAQQGVSNKVKTFIGPIFSDETRKVKEHFRNKKKLTFFSLSPDLNNVSENIIVSGQNPNDQISCITKHIAENESTSVLLIHHSDKYGYVIRNSFLNYINDFGVKGIDIDFFEVDAKTDLNNEIKKISKFKERKQQLQNEIIKIRDNAALEEESKNKEIKSLERMLTLGSPFDSIIIASEGDRLLEILSHLAFYDINSENSKIYGTSLWEDTNKKDNLFKGTYYASSLKYKDDNFVQNFKNVFAKDPMSFNYHMHDLLGLVGKYKIMSRKEKESSVFSGEFTNSKIKSGFLQREIYLKRMRSNQKAVEVFSCRLNVI